MDLMPNHHNDVPEEQYLVSEPEAEYKSEYRQGRIVAMAGASLAHSQIQMNLGRELGVALKDTPCHVFSSETRIKVASARFYTYPDLSATCAEPVVDRLDAVALVNPALIVEVLSPSSEAYDRGQKFEWYRQLPSLQDYLLVWQDRVQLELRSRRGDGAWQVTAVTGRGDTLALTGVPAQLQAADVYLKVL
jgi:Uma2 family endonuclease